MNNTTTVPMSRITHLHIEVNSRDCDGRYVNESVWSPAEGRTARELFTWWVQHLLKFAGEDAVIERGVDFHGLPYIEIRESTEEGWRNELITGCHLTICRLKAPRRRDLTAEESGY